MTPRAAWCDAMLDALYGRAVSDPAVRGLARQPGFSVYRNSVIKASIDALAANFPAVARLTGDGWFRSAAAEYACHEPPSSVSLLDYGSGFPAFLAAAPSARALPFLADVARLELMWLGCHTAADGPVLDAAALAACDGARLGALRLVPHPSARWAWWPAAPVVSLWHANRDQDAGPPASWQGEGVLLTRPHGAVAWRPIGAGHAAVLEGCAAGAALAEAGAMGLAAEADLDLARVLADLLLAGAFTSFID